MKSIEELTKEITDITTNIETNYPELHQFLTETPITISHKPGEQVKQKDLEKHLETLRTILKRYEETKSIK